MKKFLILFSAFVLLGSARAQSLFINEFMASNDSCYADEFGGYDDWIEIYNFDTVAVDIGGMYITDDLTNPTAWQIPDTSPDLTTIPPGGFLVLWADKEPEQGVLHVKLKLSGGGEQIGLFAKDGVTPIDTLTFGEQTTDVSYGRIIDGGNEWAFFPKHKDIGYTASPGRSNVTIKINEFMASNDTTIANENGDYADWIELYNYGTAPIDIAGMYLTDDLTDPTAWQIPVSTSNATVIPAGGFLLLWADKKPENGILHVDFKLSSGGEQIGLFEFNGIPIDTLSYGEQTTDVSYGRLPDGTDNWQFFTKPTPGASNSNATSVEEVTFPKNYNLSQNYPNPFNPTTTISYSIPTFRGKQSLNVTLSVYNLLGQKVATLVNKAHAPGNYSVQFDASNLPSGVYFYRLRAGSFVATKKMVLLK
jgi:hypothetical protein